MHLPENLGLGRSQRVSCIFFVFLYSVIANIPFWAASHWLGLLPLGWFCFEYVGVGFVALFVSRLLAVSLLLVIVAADVLCGVSKTYYLSPEECFSNSGFLRELPAARLLAVAAVCLLAFLVILLAANVPKWPLRGNYRLGAAGALFAVALIGVGADYIAIFRDTGHVPSPFKLGRPVDANKFTGYGSLWFYRYPSITLAKDQRVFSTKHGTDGSLADYSAVQGATASALHSAGLTEAKGSMHPDLVVIVVESWGLGTDPMLRNALVHPYLQSPLLLKYDVQQGSVPFHGPTIDGETRELCGSSIGFNVQGATPAQLQTCLPATLSALGYHDIAAHGMDGHMFARSDWYDHIGFQERWFRTQFRELGLPECLGAFRGTCDASIARWVGHRLEQPHTHPDFVYWMTLNSHLPVPVPSGIVPAASCSLTPELVQQPALCSWYQFEANVHLSISQLAMSNLARPAVFVIVGDHAPPFSNATIRGQFSQTAVPYVLLLPRQTKMPQNLAGTGVSQRPGSTETQSVHN